MYATGPQTLDFRRTSHFAAAALAVPMAVTSLLFAMARPAAATLVNYYTFDNASNLGEDSVGTRDLTRVDLGSGAATVAQQISVTDSLGLTRTNVLRTAGTTFTTDTTNGTYFTDDLGVSNVLPVFSVSLWARTDVADLPGFNGLFSTDEANNFQIDRGDNGANPDQLRLLGQSPVTIVSGDDVGEKGMAVDDWIHVAVTYDGTSSRFYVEGDLIGTVAANLGNEFQAINIASNRGENRLHDGDLDDVGIFTRTLSDAAVKSVVTLFEEPLLNYDLDEVNQLLEAFDSSTNEVTVDGTDWVLVTDGSISSPVGELTTVVKDGIPTLAINLGAGNGMAIAPVPEPGSGLMLGLGLFCLARRRRRS